MSAPRAQFTEEANGQRYFGERGAAGCIVVAQSTGRILLCKRSARVQEPHTWATWGGAIEEGSNPARTAVDELYEETGYDRSMVLEPLCVYRSPGGKFSYHNFVAIVPDEYEAWDSHENEDARWVDFGDWPQPMHFGLKHLINDAPSMQRLAQIISEAKAGKDFVSGAPVPERTLYHCLYKDPEGDALLPLSERTENGRTDKFLYATHNFAKALAYAFSYHNRQDIGGNGQIDGTPDEFALVCTRDKTMAEPRNVRVYAFSSKGFEPSNGCPSIARQWVSTKPVPFADAQLSYRTTDVFDLMRKGLQIFSIAQGPDEFYASGLADKYWNMGGPEKMLPAMVRDGVAVWENRDRPHPEGKSLYPNKKIMAALNALPPGAAPSGTKNPAP